MAKWKYIEKRPLDKNKNSAQDSFFNLSTEASALVREAIQNSLDAQLDPDQPVRIRFFIADKKDKLSFSSISKWFDQIAWSHYEAEGNGLIDIPSKSDSCPFLVYEDFNTTGLNGDIEQHSRKVGCDNSFYSFFRAEGESGKHNKLGSHGLGKIVFPMSSRIRTIFALTTRSSDKITYLAGQSTLKFHKIGEDTFHPDGWYGKFIEDETEFKDFQLPVDDVGLIKEFKKSFQLSRKINDTGLSLVIPWLDESINYKNLKRCVIEDYYPAIMDKALEVEIVDNSSRPYILNYNTLPDCANNEELDFNIKSKIDLAFEYYTTPGLHGVLGIDESVTLNSAKETKPEWSNKLFPEGSITKIIENLENGTALIKVPVIINPKKGDLVKSYFHVVLKASDSLTKPTFIRDKLIITNAHPFMLHGYTALIFIKDKALTTFLGLSETPAHTRWDWQSTNFKGQYNYGRELIRYIARSATEVVTCLQTEDEKSDPEVLSNFFSIKSPETKSGKTRKKRKKHTAEIDIPEDIIRSKRYFQESQIDSGFKISGTEDISNKRKFKVLAAYDLVKGNPFLKWNRADFLTKDMKINSDYISELVCENNQLTFIAENDQFYIEVEGFDLNRDLRVKTTSIEVEDA